MPYIHIDRSDPIVPIVVLDRPDRLNALGPELVQGIKDAMAELTRDRAARAVVIRGEGRGFCSGADLTGDGPPSPDSEGRGPVGATYRAQEHIAEMMTAVHECEKPLIAAVHGAAVGGGLALALASDLRVADHTTRFGSVFIRVGLSSCDMGVSYFLPRIVGATRAAELMLTGRHFSAEEADRWGMLNGLVDPGEHVTAAVELGHEIAENNEYGVWMTKKGLWENIDAPSYRHALEVENRTQVLGMFTGNMREASAAFQAKRDPVWEPM